MESRLSVRLKRIIALAVFLIYDVLQIYLVGHIIVQPNENLIIRYKFSWSRDFTVDIATLFLFLLIPFLVSYFTAFRSITRSNSLVQIIGPKSLMRRVELEFHSGNPEGQELSVQNVRHLLADMAKNEPSGTMENLEALLSVGIMVNGLLKKSGIKSVKRVYVSDDLVPNAFTLRVIPLPFFGQDWIIINRNMLDILEQDELQAVVAHEIGHAARKDSWINSLLFSPRLVIILIWSILLASMGNIILDSPFSLSTVMRLITIILLIIIIRFLMNLGLFITNYAYRKTELLADYYAAKLVGSEILINALIKIGRRAEVLRTIGAELDWLNNQFPEPDQNLISSQALNYLDPSEISTEKARKTVLKIFATQKLIQTMNGLRIGLNRKEIDDLVIIASKNLEKERGIKDEKEEVMLRLDPLKTEQITKDWKSVDLDNNKRLDRSEIEELVTAINLDNKRIFETEALEKSGALPITKTHPQVSDRITFLYRNLMINKKNDKK